MTEVEKKNPVALAGAHRVDVKNQESSNDIHVDTSPPYVRQAEYLLRLYGLPIELAHAVAEHAFDNGRRS